MTPGAKDKVDATVTGFANGSTVVFANEHGLVYNSTNTGNNYTITLAGGPEEDAQYIYAWEVNTTVTPNTKTLAGKLLVPSYPSLTKNMIIIPKLVFRNSFFVNCDLCIKTILQF